MNYLKLIMKKIICKFNLISMDQHKSSPQLVEWSKPLYLDPLTKIAVNDKDVEDIKWVEISPIESGDFGFQYQDTMTYNLNNPNGLVLLDNLYGMCDVQMASGTTGTLANGSDGFFVRETYQTQNGIVLENNLHANEVKAALDTFNRTSADLLMDWDLDEPINTSLSGDTVINATARSIVFKPRFSFGKLNKCFHSCKGGTTQVQLQYADDRAILQSAQTTTPKIKFTNPRLFVQYVDVSVEQRQRYLKTDILYNYEQYAFMSNLWSGTSNNVALRVAAKKCNWALLKNHVLADFNRCSAVDGRANPYIKKFPFPDTSANDYQLNLTYGGKSIPQSALKKAIQMYRFSIENLKLDAYNNVGNIMTKAQYIAKNITDANCATYSNIPQHLVFVDLSKAGINTGISLIDEPLIVSDVLSANAPVSGVDGSTASVLYKDSIIGYSVIASLTGYQNIEVSSV